MTLLADAPAPPASVSAGAHAAPEERPDVPRRIGRRDGDSLAAVAGSAVGALALTWLLFERILPASGVVGFWVSWYVAFVLLFAAVTALRHDRRDVSDRIAAVLFTSAGVAVFAVVALVVGYTGWRGWSALRPSFFTSTMAQTGPLDPLGQGGVLHAMVGTLEQISIALAICVPLGVAAALFLNEVRGPLARPVRMLVDAMSAIPSIVAGLFVLATVILSLGYDKSGLAASLAIAVEMLPVVTRSAELVFRLVPGGLREASTALGSTQWRTVWKVVLPTAKAGLATTVVLGIARGIGETAPVLLVSGFTSGLNLNPLHGAQVSLPLYILTYVKYPQDTMHTRAYGAALALLVTVLLLFVLARLVGGRGATAAPRRRSRPSGRPTWSEESA